MNEDTVSPTMEDNFDSYALTGWFPGHMFKASRQMSETLNLIDLAVELVDARAPWQTRNPELRKMLANKPYLLIANKADLANPAANRAWERRCRQEEIPIHFLDSRRVGNVKALPELWRRLVMKERASRGATRPLLRPVRVMVAGVPNVGKSTLVNHLNEKNRAQVGPKPGVTRNNQWVTLDSGVELLDTPGILWPHIENKKHELMLALLGIMNDELIPQELLAGFLAWKMETMHPKMDWSPYGLSSAPENVEQLLQAFAEKRKFVRPGGIMDLQRAATTFVKDFRDGKMGKISFDWPPQKEKTE